MLGDDWEHEEIFTDDDEAVGNDPEEREDLAPEVPAPPEIKQVYDCFCHFLMWVCYCGTSGLSFLHYLIRKCFGVKASKLKIYSDML